MNTDPFGNPHNLTLTVMELEAAHLAKFDLGPGYPQLPVPDYVTRLYLDDRIEEMSLQTSPAWTPESQARMDANLDAAVRGFIGLETDPDSRPELRVTFTGSIALDRVISAVKRFARNNGSPHIDVVTTTPSIDIMRLFLAEHSEITSHFVESRKGGVLGALDLHSILDALRALRSSSRTLVCLLTSPENPTGEIWSKDALTKIAKECERLGAILIVDHCFVVAGVQSTPVARVWDVAPDQLNWMATWDTGKTFGLNEDKLGFIVCGTKSLTFALDEALAVMQFGVARRQKLFFTEILREAVDSHYLASLRRVCQGNLKSLVQALEGTSLIVRAPKAGSLALIDVGRTGLTDEQVRRRLMDNAIGVISGNVFFHGGWVPRNYVRVALARPQEHFDAAVKLILEILACAPKQA